MLVETWSVSTCTIDFFVKVDTARSCGLNLDCLRIAILSLAHKAQFLVAKVLTTLITAGFLARWHPQPLLKMCFWTHKVKLVSLSWLKNQQKEISKFFNLLSSSDAWNGNSIFSALANSCESEIPYFSIAIFCHKVQPLQAHPATATKSETSLSHWQSVEQKFDSCLENLCILCSPQHFWICVWMPDICDANAAQHSAHQMNNSVFL